MYPCNLYSNSESMETYFDGDFFCLCFYYHIYIYCRGVFHGGDSDSTGSIASCWFGAMYGMENVYEKNHKVSGKYENDLDGKMCNLGHLAMWRCNRFSWYKEGSRLRLFKYFNAMVAKLIKIWCSNSTIFNIIFNIIIWFLSHLYESKPYEEVSHISCHHPTFWFAYKCCNFTIRFTGNTSDEITGIKIYPILYLMYPRS